MLEILILFKLAGNIGRIVTAKGHKKGWYQLLLVVLWFGGELLGAVFGLVLGAVLVDVDEPPFFLSYVCALGGAALGAGTAFFIAKRLPDLKREDDEFYAGDDYGRRWREEGRSAGEPDRPRPDEGKFTERPSGGPHPDDRIRE
jgi:hypothetical protein